MEKELKLYDEWGPEYVVRVAIPEINLVGFLVIDNTTLGPGKGGIRMTPDVTEEEVRRLARAMTWKNALAGIPFGGAKAGIRFSGSQREKKRAVQEFAKAISIFTPGKYIAGPDVNTGEQEMQWFVEATGNWRSATGKPATLCLETFGKIKQQPRTRTTAPEQSSVLGTASSVRGKCGIPHEFGSTGFGVAEATRVAAELMKLSMRGATVAIHGFGNVGSFTAKYLKAMGAKIVAIATKEEATLRLRSGQAKKISHADFWRVPVDILIPASVTDVINNSNKDDIQARLIVEGANIPMQESIEAELFKRGVLIVPDFVANAGGVISSYAEYRGYNPKQMFETVKQKIIKSTRLVLERALQEHLNPRTIALQIAKEQLLHAKATKKGR